MASSGEQITRNLRCPICFEPYGDPKLLSCAHTFCNECLISVLACSSQTSASSLACPICRSTTDIENGDVVNLKTNHTIKSFVDDVRNNRLLCDMCHKKSIATYYCYECEKCLCSECLEKHNNWPPNVQHKVTSLDEITKGKVVTDKEIYCLEHTSERKKRVCTDVCRECEKFICERCLVEDHTDHVVQRTQVYNVITKVNIEHFQENAETKVSALKDHQACIENQKKRVNKQFDHRKNEINKIRQDAIKRIQQRWETLDMQLESQRKKSCKKLDEMNSHDERLVTSLESASALVGKSLKAPLDYDTILIRESLSETLTHILKENDTHDQHAISVADRAEQLIFAQSSRHDQLSLGEVRFLSCKLEKVVEFSKEDEINVMAVTQDGNMAIGYRSAGIGIFSAEGQLLKKVLTDVSICKVAFLSDGRYVVCQRGVENTITLFTPEQTEISVYIETLNEDVGGESDLTVDSNDVIYISYMKAEKIQTIFLPAVGRAKKIRDIPCNGYEPVQITSYEDSLIVTCVKTILRIDREGNVKHKLQRVGFTPYAAVTQNNSILVAWLRDNDRTMSIDEYTNELNLIRHVISDQTIEKHARRSYYLKVFPSGEIAFCTPDRLYIFN